MDSYLFCFCFLQANGTCFITVIVGYFVTATGGPNPMMYQIPTGMELIEVVNGTTKNTSVSIASVHGLFHEREIVNSIYLLID